MALLRWLLRWCTRHPDDHGYHSDHERHPIHLEYRGGMDAAGPEDD